MNLVSLNPAAFMKFLPIRDSPCISNKTARNETNYAEYLLKVKKKKLVCCGHHKTFFYINVVSLFKKHY